MYACGNFDEQCALWRNWANCKESESENQWIIAVGERLMQSGKYNPLLERIWIGWRALCQSFYFGVSRDSVIPNAYYNKFRNLCYVTCLKRIESHPDDIYAITCAAVLGSWANLNRFGERPSENEAVTEAALMMPNRY